METISNFINGEFVPAASGKVLPNINPSTGKKYGDLPDSDTDDVTLAVRAAKQAFTSWSNTSSKERSRILNKIADLIERDLEALALAETLDNGKPIKTSSSVDIPRAIDNFRFFAASALHFSSEAHIMENVAINYTVRAPLGVVGCISPWNLPLYLFTWKIAPALATGNCVIAKPSELSPMTAFLLCRICQEAGLPPGVLNVLHGLGSKVGKAIVAHPEILAISFTGGTETGKNIAAVAAPMFKKLSLELGGKNPNIIFNDCDFDEAVEMTIKSSFSNQGQICLCGSRIFVQRAIYDRFKSALVKGTLALKTGNPSHESSDLGALISKDHLEKILCYTKMAQEEGGEILTGGKQLFPKGQCSGGYFFTPTIFEGLPVNCKTNSEEIFGPIVTLTPFETEEEVLDYANFSNFGLSATVWTRDLSRAHRVAHALNTGIIWINTWLLRDLRTPFGGMKQSGMGREGGEEVLKFFTEPKNVCVKM